MILGRLGKIVGVVLAALFGIIFIRATLPPINHVKLEHPDGFSIRIPKNIYACVDGTGFSVDMGYRLDDHKCVGPTPKITKGQAMRYRIPPLGFYIAPASIVPSLSIGEFCESYFKRRTMFRYGKRARYSVCSAGGGSGGLEYSAVGFTRESGRIFVAGAWTQADLFAPSFKQTYRTLLTIHTESQK